MGNTRDPYDALQKHQFRSLYSCIGVGPVTLLPKFSHQSPTQPPSSCELTTLLECFKLDSYVISEYIQTVLPTFEV